MVISMLPTSGQADAKFAVELGLSIMLDKPIVVVAREGQHVPAKLERVANAVIRADARKRGDRARIAARLNEMRDELGL